MDIYFEVLQSTRPNYEQDFWPSLLYLLHINSLQLMSENVFFDCKVVNSKPFRAALTNITLMRKKSVFCSLMDLEMYFEA